MEKEFNDFRYKFGFDEDSANDVVNCMTAPLNSVPGIKIQTMFDGKEEKVRIMYNGKVLIERSSPASKFDFPDDEGDPLELEKNQSIMISFLMCEILEEITKMVVENVMPGENHHKRYG